MKLKLIAASIGLIASSAALAQSNVTIFGTLDLGIRHTTSSGKESTNQIGSMGSNLFGFKGTEDLGNGLSAGFILEGGFSSDTGAGAGTQTGTTGSKLFSRQSLLFLSNKELGTVQAGRFNTFARAAVLRANPNPLGLVDGQVWLAQQAGFAIASNGFDADNSGARISNAVGYVSPNFGGVTLGYLHSFAENSGTPTASTSSNPSFTSNQLWAGYANGPLNLDYVFNTIGSQGSAITAAATTALLGMGPIKEHYLGGQYDFGSIKLTGSYQTRKSEQYNTDKITTIGASIPVSAASKVSVSYAQLRMGSDLKGKSTLGNANFGFGAGASTVLDDASAWALGYNYALSKRTSAYTTYTRLKNSGAGTVTVAAVPQSGGSSSLFSVGMQHNF